MFLALEASDTVDGRTLWEVSATAEGMTRHGTGLTRKAAVADAIILLGNELMKREAEAAIP